MKRILAFLLVCTLMFATACDSDQKNINPNTAEKTVEGEDLLGGEDGVVRWARGHSGNLMMTMAEHNGYLEEYGLKVEQIPMQTTDESFAAVSGDQLDIVSNAGTATPLTMIVAGSDLVIFGGHMVEGSVSIGALKETPYEGLESLIGKRMTGDHLNYPFTGPLLEMGYDPENDIEWVELTGDMDGIAALKSGIVDFATHGTSLTYQLKNDPDLELKAKFGEIMPDYSCCRMETASRFIEEKPNTTKALLKALLRGLKDYHDNPEYASELLAEELDVPLEFIEAYTLDAEGYKIHPDPLYNSCVRALAYMSELGMITEEELQGIDLRDNINIELYKQALDEVIEEVGDEDPEYWQEQLDYFEEHNSMYFDKEEEAQYYKDFKETIETNRKKVLDSKK